MKKKLFLGALLLGALTLNSCVDNVESDSVKSVRQAKAEQLKAKADLDKANAEAALIDANTAKAAAEALAEYNKAQAALANARAEKEKAEAALANAQAESERAAAAQAAEQAKIDLEEAQAKLDLYKQEVAKLAAQYEAELYKQQLAALKAKKDYEDAVKNAEKEEIATLMKAYQDAADALRQGQQTLAGFKLQLAKLEAGLISPEESIQDDIDRLNRKKNTLLAKIQGAQDYIDILRTDDYADAEAKLPEAQKTLDALRATQAEKLSAQSSAYATQTNAWNALDKSDYMSAVKKVQDLNKNSISFSTNWGISKYKQYLLSYYDYSGSQTKCYFLSIEQNNGKWCALAESYVIDNYGYYNYDPASQDYIPLFSIADNYEQKELKYTDSYTDQDGEPQTATYLKTYWPYTSFYNLVEGGMDKFVKAAKDFVKEGAQTNLDNAKKAYDDQVKVVTPLQTLYDNLASLKATYDDKVKTLNEALRKDPNADSDGKLQKAVDDALLEFNKALKDTDYEGQGISALSNCENDLNNANIDLTRCLQNKNRAENELNEANEKVAKIEGYAKTLNDGNDGNTAAMKAYNDALVAYCQAQIDYQVATNAVTVQNSIVNALSNVVNSYNHSDSQTWLTKAQLIQAKEDEIAGWNLEIEEKNAEIASLEKINELDKQEAIDSLKAEIANQEAVNVNLENKVKAAKEELDAALGEPEETPAE